MQSPCQFLRSIDFHNPIVIMWIMIVLAILAMAIGRVMCSRMRHALAQNDIDRFLSSHRIFSMSTFLGYIAIFGAFVVQIVTPEGYSIPLASLFTVNMVLSLLLLQSTNRLSQTVQKAEAEGVFADVFLHHIKGCEDYLNSMLSINGLTAIAVAGYSVDWRGAKAAILRQ